MCVPGTCGGEKRVLATLKQITNGCELPHGGWEPNLDPLQEQ